MAAFKERVKSLGAMMGSAKREGEVWEAREVAHPGETPAQAGLMIAVRQEEEAEKAAREATLSLYYQIWTSNPRFYSLCRPLSVSRRPRVKR